MQGVVFVGSAAADEVTVAVPLPVRVVDVFAEPVRTVVAGLDVDVSVPDEAAVAFWTMEVVSEDNCVVPRVILDEKDWYVPVGVCSSDTLVPERKVRPSVLSVGS